jgi:hypothetical protein
VTTTELPAEAPWAAVLDLVEVGIGAANAHGRDDLEEPLRVARLRLMRPQSVIAVVGEFKQGKSSLINGLVGEELCPVHDDVATTTTTVLRYGDSARCLVTRHGADAAEEVDPAFATGIGLRPSPDEAAAIQRIELEWPNRFLATGITLIDTPGAGSASRDAGLALAFLRVADALIFVTDASAPLSGDELDFLKSASAYCPVVMCCLAKTDLYPHWREVQSIDESLLAGAGLPARPIPVSAALRIIALKEGDAGLNRESGFPELLQVLSTGVLEETKRLAAHRALLDLDAAVHQIRLPVLAELQALKSPDLAAPALAELQSRRDRVEQLRQAGSRWGSVLAEGFSDLANETDYRFRGALRELNKKVDRILETADLRHDWVQISGEVRTDMALAVRELVRSLEEGSADIARRVVSVIAEDEAEIAVPVVAWPDIDVSRYWTEKEQRELSLGAHAGLGYASLKGAQGGIILASVMAGVAGVVLSTTATLGVGAVFGGKQIWDERKKKTTQRRQQARTVVRQFIDDVQFDVSKTTRDMVRDLQRLQREHFATELAQRIRTQTEAMEASQRGAQTARENVSRRVAELEQTIQGTDQLLKSTSALRGSL